MSEPARYKGKFIKKSVLEKRMKTAEALAESRKRLKTEVKSKEEVKYVCEGSRIIDVQELVKNLFCSDCNGILHLKDIVSEKRLGLHIIWNIRCDFCEEITEVATGKTHTNPGCFKSFADVNTKAALGATETEIGCDGLNKVLTCLNIPEIPPNIYKQYEREIGAAVEAVAVNFCKFGTHEERQMLLENNDEYLHEPEETDPLAISPKHSSKSRQS